MQKEVFLQYYSAVFAPNGDIMPCGRMHCMELIHACKKFGSSIKYYGNDSTGHLDIPAIKSLVAEQMPEIIFKEHYLKVFDTSGNLINSSEDAISSLLVSCNIVKPGFSTDAPKASSFDEASVKVLFKELFPNEA